MITLQLTKEQLDLIWYALGKLPYEQSYKLIEELKRQYQWSLETKIDDETLAKED